MIKTLEIKEENIQVEPSIKKMKARALLINSSNEILIANYGGVFLLPGGSIEKGENPNLAIVREIKEETGIDRKIEDLKPFLKMRYYQIGYPERNGKKSNRLLITYYYLGNLENFSMKDSRLSEKEKKDEFELEFYSLDEIEKLIKNNDSNNPRKKYFDKELEIIIEQYRQIEKDTIDEIRL